MLSIILTIAAAVVIGRMAETDRGEGLKWGAITFGLCFITLFLPLSLLGTLLACGLSLGLMTMTKKTYY